MSNDKGYKETAKEEDDKGFISAGLIPSDLTRWAQKADSTEQEELESLVLWLQVNE